MKSHDQKLVAQCSQDVSVAAAVRWEPLLALRYSERSNCPTSYNGWQEVVPQSMYAETAPGLRDWLEHVGKSLHNFTSKLSES